MVKYESIPVEEVLKILKKPQNREAKNKLDHVIGSLSGFQLINHVSIKKYNQAPIKPCVACDGGISYGVALQNHARHKQTLLICLDCGGITIKPFNQFPFHLGRGSENNERKTKKTKKELVLG